MYCSGGLIMNIKFLSLSTLAFLTGALVLGYAPKMEMTKAGTETIYEVGYARTYADGKMEDDNHFFLVKSNNAPYKSNKSIKYIPQSQDAVRFIRDDVSYNVGTNLETIVRLSKTKCELQTSMFADALGWNSFSLQHGDRIVLDGSFSYTDGDSNIHTLVISETTFLCSVGRDVNGTPERTYFAALPQHITDTTNYTFEMANKTWHFLFDIKGLEEEDAPLSGDDSSKAYYPTSSECFYVDGKPVARVEKEGLRRRDPDSYEWYPTINSDIQNIEQYLDVDSIFVIDGLFACYQDISEYKKNNARLGLYFKMLAFRRTGTGANDYVIINLQDYLYNNIHNQYTVEDFVESDQDTALEAMDLFDEKIELVENTKEAYAAYNAALGVLSALEVDSGVLARMKQEGIQTINNYVDIDEYFDTEKAAVLAYLTEYEGKINNANNRGEINDLIEEFKDKVDLVKKNYEIMSDAIINQQPGYEEYLEEKDQISLSDLGIDETLTFHGKLNERANDFNTNVQENNLHNTFAPSKENKNGNVEFFFSYTPSAIPVDGANVMVNLRGTAYYGYKFGIDSNSRGNFVSRVDSSISDFLGGNEGSYVNGVTYEIAVGAIDLVDEVGKTWIYIKIDGDFIFSKVVDSLSICTNPRVAISGNDNNLATNDYEGTVEVSNTATNIVEADGSYLGRFVYKEGNSNEIKASLDPNSLPANGDGLEKSYATRKSNIQLIRNNVTTDVAQTAKPFIKKINENNYVLDIANQVEVQDQDIIVISGAFSYYNDSDAEKTAFVISTSRFQYNASTDSWTPILSLAEAKEDACKKLESYADLSKYDEDEKAAIAAIVLEGKEAINNATSIEEVDAAYLAYKGRIDAVKTSLQKYQDQAIEIVNEYKAQNINDYRQDEKDEIASLKAEAIQDIHNANTKEEIDEIVVALKMAIDELKTDAEYAIEELADAIKEGQQTIYSHYASLNTSNYTAAQLSQLEQDTQDAINAVKAAASIDEVNRIVEAYINNHQQINNKPKTGGCNASINGDSSIIFIAAIGGLVLAIRKAYSLRKKEE